MTQNRRNADLIEFIPEVYDAANKAAMEHFHGLWECITKEIPDCVRANFKNERPKGFTSSTHHAAYFISSANHVPIKVVFAFQTEPEEADPHLTPAWELEAYLIPLGTGFLFGDQLECQTLGDALLAAREIYEATHIDKRPELEQTNTEGLRVM